MTLLNRRADEQPSVMALAFLTFSGVTSLGGLVTGFDDKTSMPILIGDLVGGLAVSTFLLTSRPGNYPHRFLLAWVVAAVSLFIGFGPVSLTLSGPGIFMAVRYVLRTQRAVPVARVANQHPARQD
jgi:hypothetical protein